MLVFCLPFPPLKPDLCQKQRKVPVVGSIEAKFHIHNYLREDYAVLASGAARPETRRARINTPQDHHSAPAPPAVIPATGPSSSGRDPVAASSQRDGEQNG